MWTCRHVIVTVLGMHLSMCKSACVNRKRGFIASNPSVYSSCNDALLLNHTSWFYSRNVDNRSIEANRDTCDQARLSMLERLTPMYSDHGGYADGRYLLLAGSGHQLKESHITPVGAAQEWQRAAKSLPSSTFVTPWISDVEPALISTTMPATMQESRAMQWLDDFFGNCTHLFGSGGCNVSYISAETYSCSPTYTMRFLKTLHNRYKLPVWLTKLSCVSGEMNHSTAEQMKCMKDILPLLDEAEYVFRYAWSGSRDSHGLVDAGPHGLPRLSALGTVYNSCKRTITVDDLDRFDSSSQLDQEVPSYFPGFGTVLTIISGFSAMHLLFVAGVASILLMLCTHKKTGHAADDVRCKSLAIE